jgi:hypothetical protein
MPSRASAHRCTVLALSLACISPQDGELSIAEEIDALIARTNAIHSCRLLYRGSSGSDSAGHGEASLELIYVAPWQARMRMKTAESVVDVCADKNRFYILEPESGEVWRSCELPYSEAYRVLDGLFPSDTSIGSGPVFELKGGDKIEYSLSFNISGRSSPFGWFPRMRRDPEGVTREDERLIWSSGVLTLCISRTTGLLEDVAVRQEGKNLALHLESITDVDADECFAIPGESALIEEDLELKAMIAQLFSLDRQRETGFLRVEGQLRIGMRSWDADTRADWASFLDVLHRERMPERWGEWMEELRKNADETAVWARTSLEVNGSDEHRAAVERAVVERKSKLDEGFTKAIDDYLAELPKVQSGSFEVRNELFEIEKNVVERLHNELVSTPIRTYFQEQVDAALGERR